MQVEALRKRQKPMSNRAAGRVAKYDKPVTEPEGKAQYSFVVLKKPQRNRASEIKDLLIFKL